MGRTLAHPCVSRRTFPRKRRARKTKYPQASGSPTSVQVSAARRPWRLLAAAKAVEREGGPEARAQQHRPSRSGGRPEQGEVGCCRAGEGKGRAPSHEAHRQRRHRPDEERGEEPHPWPLAGGDGKLRRDLHRGPGEQREDPLRRSARATARRGGSARAPAPRSSRQVQSAVARERDEREHADQHGVPVEHAGVGPGQKSVKSGT